MRSRFVIILLLIAGCFTISLGQESNPAYALAFRANDKIYLAQYREESGWETAALPNFLLFGQYDASLVLPKWTANGELMGIGYEPGLSFETEPMYDEPAAYLYRYNLQSDSMEVMTEPIETVQGEMPLILGISAISPDGRYVSLYNVVDISGGYLVDFESQETVFKLDSCGLKAFHWTESSVFLGSYAIYITCPSSFLEVDLSSGEILMDASESLAEQDITVVDEAVWLGDSEFLLAAYGQETYYQLVHLDAETSNLIAPLNPESLTLSENQQFAAFSSEGNLILLDLQTRDSLVVAAANSRTSSFFEGESLHYGEEIIGEDAVQYRHSIYSSTGQESWILYEGNSRRYAFSPDFSAVAISRDDGLAVYGEMGLLWESGEPDLTESEFWWSDDGIWLRIETESATMSVNPVTGEMIEAPEEYARFISTSPDGQWWLYMVRNPEDENSMYSSERLFLYQPATGEIVVLVDGENLYDNFHFPIQSYFIWSPIQN